MLNVKENSSLKSYNTLAVDVQALFLITVDDLLQIPDAVSFAEQRNLPFLILGGGSNVVLTADFPGVVIHIQLHGISIEDDESSADVIVNAAAGEEWHQLVQYCLANNYYGLENLSLIPGSVGAAPIQNIGAYGTELADVFFSLTGWDCQQNKWRTLYLADCQFAYRDSIFKRALKNQFIISSLSLRLHRNASVNVSYGALDAELDKQNIEAPTPQQVADTVVQIRQSKLPDPKLLANVGSFFKNPIVSAANAERLLAEHPDMVSYLQADGDVKLAAGWLLEKAGWKGRRVGAVGMHQLQSLVLINYDDGDGSDIVKLASAIQHDVKQQFDLELEIEPVVI